MKKSFGILLIAISTFLSVFAQTTAFTYQGSLKDGATPANGNYDFEFKLFDLVSAAQIDALKKLVCAQNPTAGLCQSTAEVKP